MYLLYPDILQTYNKFSRLDIPLKIQKVENKG